MNPYDAPLNKREYHDWLAYVGRDDTPDAWEDFRSETMWRRHLLEAQHVPEWDDIETCWDALV